MRHLGALLGMMMASEAARRPDARAMREHGPALPATRPVKRQPRAEAVAAIARAEAKRQRRRARNLRNAARRGGE